MLSPLVNVVRKPGSDHGFGWTDFNASPKVGFDWILAMVLLSSVLGSSQSESCKTLSSGVSLGVVLSGGPLTILL